MSSPRKSISVRGPTYFRLKNQAELQGKTASGLLEELVTQKMEELEKANLVPNSAGESQ